jgi:hypothetical protein
MFSQQCFISWSVKWTECMSVESMRPRRRLKLDSVRQLLCYTCIYDREYELDIENELTDDQEAQLAMMKEYMISTGGGPPLELLEAVRLL